MSTISLLYRIKPPDAREIAQAIAQNPAEFYLNQLNHPKPVGNHRFGDQTDVDSMRRWIASYRPSSIELEQVQSSIKPSFVSQPSSAMTRTIPAKDAPSKSNERFNTSAPALVVPQSAPLNSANQITFHPASKPVSNTSTTAPTSQFVLGLAPPWRMPPTTTSSNQTSNSANKPTQPAQVDSSSSAHSSSSDVSEPEEAPKPKKSRKNKEKEPRKKKEKVPKASKANVPSDFSGLTRTFLIELESRATLLQIGQQCSHIVFCCIS
jgi:hypothetical protein